MGNPWADEKSREAIMGGIKLAAKKRVAARLASAVDGPAKLHAGHKQDRHLTAIAGGPIGWRNRDEHPLSAALAMGRIDADEFAAGDAYRTLYEAKHRSGRDSTQGVPVTGSSGLPVTPRQAWAIQEIAKIDRRMNEKWLRVVVLFCGEAHSAAQTCHMVGAHPNYTWHLIAVALNKLALAIARSGVDFHGKIGAN